MTIKAIDTRYAGHRFRSRLEARWAVFFDHLGLEWVYEPEGYELPSGAYLPDFWLPAFGAWLEIKPVGPTDAEKRLCEELANATGFPALIGVGVPASRMLAYSGKWREACMAICATTGRPCLDGGEVGGGILRASSACTLFAPDGSMPISDAAVAACSARFEFGQTPRRTKA